MNFPGYILNKIKTSLVSLKKKRQETLKSLKTQDPYSDPDRVNDNAASDTEAKEESSHERVEAIEKELKKSLDEINQALIRIKKGTYGKCLSCKSIIDTDRLAVKPTALFCVECEKKREKK